MQWTIRQRTFIFALLLQLFLGYSCMKAFSQVATATIVGTVSDTTGSVMPGVKVVATNIATKLTYSAVTDQSGDYTISQLPPGRYTLTAAVHGFKSWTANQIHLAIADRLSLNPKMEVGGISQSVTVNAGTPALQTESSTVGNLVTHEAVEDLPLNGRNFIQLAQYAPGATQGAPNAIASGTRPDDRRQTSAVSVNAQDSSLNNFLLDGLDDNERSVGTIVAKPDLDAIEEMRVDTNNYSAELGRTAGGVISFVTKSGTNNFHGTLYEFFRNEVLDAKNYFNGPGPTPAFKQNQFGGSIGGPIRKDRTFFFADYERFDLVQGLTMTEAVPTLGQRAGCFTVPIYDPLTTTPSGTRVKFIDNCIPVNRWDPASAKIVNSYPLPNNGSSTLFTRVANKTQFQNTWDARVDHTFSNNDSMFGRWTFNGIQTLIPSAYPSVNGINLVGDPGSFPGPASQRAQAGQISYSHIFSPSLVLVAKFGYTRYGEISASTNTGIDVSSELGIPGNGSDLVTSGVPVINNDYTIGDAEYVPIIAVDNTYEEMVNVTYTRGPHEFMFGFNDNDRQVAYYQSPYARGQFNFDANLTNNPLSPSGTGDPFASFLLGYPASVARNEYLVHPILLTKEPSAFALDNWHVNGTLTLNLGVRWDYYSPLTEKRNRISNFDPGTGKIIIAGVNGVSASAGVKPYYNNFSPRLGFAQSIGSTTVLSGGFGISYFPPFIGSSTSLRNPPFVSLYTATSTQLTPTAGTLSQGLPPALPTSATDPTGTLTTSALNLKLAYVEQFNLRFQQELPRQNLVLTIAGVGSLSRRGTEGVDINAAAPHPSNNVPINYYRPFYADVPNVSAINEYRNWYAGHDYGLETTLERRFSKGLGLLAGYTWAHEIDNGGINDSPQYYALPNLEIGNGDLDVRNRFTLTFNYELPFPQKSSRLVSVLGKGWQVNGVTVLSGGMPFSVTNSTAQSNTGDGDRPDVIGNPYLKHKTLTEYFNVNAFALQPSGTFGNERRNQFYGPGIATQDISLFKTFNVHGQMNLEFRAEAFNVLNRPNFGQPNSSFGSSTFGQISSTGNNLPRNIQFAVKMTF